MLDQRRKTQNICIMLDQRWGDVAQMLCKCFVFAGIPAIYTPAVSLYML